MLALAFSGGKDSLACWYMTRDRDPLVLWVNTGKAYPETLRVIDMVRSQSRFVEIASDQEAQNARCGLPSDVVPIDWTDFGMQVSGTKQVKVQSYLQCCYENIAKPLNDRAKALGVTRIIRGQRTDEPHKAPPGTLDGIEYEHPIEHWTREMVLSYLEEQGPVPEHFVLDHSSMDCYDCTAYLEHSADRLAWTKRYPDMHGKYVARLRALKSTLAPSMAALERLVA